MSVLDRFSLDGEVVVVTGALGQLGKQYTAAVLEAGGKVVLLDQAAAGIPAGELDERALHVTADVTNRTSLEAALAEVVGRFGVPTGLVNNAALDSPPGAPVEETGPFETYPASSWDAVVGVNLTGTMLACQVFGGAMAEACRGAIVNVCSIYGVVSPDQRLYEHRREAGDTFYKPVAYSASKSGVLNLTRYLATYWADRGVRVNTITPGGVANDQHPDFVEAYERRVPLGRMARDDEYNAAVVFLLARASSYMTGANLVIDGGWTAW